MPELTRYEQAQRAKNITTAIRITSGLGLLPGNLINSNEMIVTLMKETQDDNLIS